MNRAQLRGICESGGFSCLALTLSKGLNHHVYGCNPVGPPPTGEGQNPDRQGGAGERCEGNAAFAVEARRGRLWIAWEQFTALIYLGFLRIAPRPGTRFTKVLGEWGPERSETNLPTKLWIIRRGQRDLRAAGNQLCCARRINCSSVSTFLTRLSAANFAGGHKVASFSPARPEVISSQ